LIAKIRTFDVLSRRGALDDLNVYIGKRFPLAYTVETVSHAKLLPGCLMPEHDIVTTTSFKNTIGTRTRHAKATSTVYG